MAASTENTSSPPVSFSTLFVEVLRKRYILIKRYPVNAISQLGVLYILFFAVFFGGKAIAGPQIQNSLDGIIVGFFIYTMAIAAFSTLSYTVIEESQWGTLEQLFMSPHGTRRVMGSTTVVGVLESVGYGVAILLLMMVTTNRWLSIDLFTIGLLIIATIATAVGFGFMFAGLALLYKRIEAIFNLLNMAIIGLVAVPVQEYPALKLLPLSQGTYLLRKAMSDGRTLWELPMAELGITLAVAVGYVTLGWFVFVRAAKRARRQGLLGEY